MIFFSPAKINLGLHILYRRDDGFHEIETAMIPIPFFDIIELQFSGKSCPELSLSGLELPVKANDNLITRAYDSYFKHRVPEPVKIHLHKQIPFGGGLGGGSSNASTLLAAMNDLCRIKLSQGELTHLAASIGSDCPFFIDPKPSIAKGRGEKLEPLELHLDGYYLILVNPGIHISTKEAYQGAEPDRDRPHLKSLVTQPISAWKEILHNDFEKSIFRRHPAIGELKAKLYEQGAIYAAMTGSGSTVFGIFDRHPNFKCPKRSTMVWKGALQTKG